MVSYSFPLFHHSCRNFPIKCCQVLSCFLFSCETFERPVVMNCTWVYSSRLAPIIRQKLKDTCSHGHFQGMKCDVLPHALIACFPDCLDLRKCHVCTFCWKRQWPERSSVPCKVENEKRSRGTSSIYFMMVGQELQKGKPMRPHTGTNIAYKYPYYLTFPMFENSRLTDCVRVCLTQTVATGEYWLNYKIIAVC